MFVCMKTRPETIILKGIPLVDKYVVTFKIATLLDFFFFLRHQRLFSKATFNIRVHKFQFFSGKWKPRCTYMAGGTKALEKVKGMYIRFAPLLQADSNFQMFA